MSEQRRPLGIKFKCSGHNCIVTVGGEKKPAEKNNTKKEN